MTPKQIAEKWFDELWNKKNRDYIYEVAAPDIVAHLETLETEGVFNETRGHQGIVDFHVRILQIFSAIKTSVINSLGDDDDACLLWEVEATSARANTAVRFRGMTWFRFGNGKVVEVWDAWNEGGVERLLSK